MSKVSSQTTPLRQWDELLRTTALVRAGAAVPSPAAGTARRWRRWLIALWVVGAAIAAAARPPAPAAADATADSQLFALTNQDRTGNGVPALAAQATLGSIAENGRYTGCGFTVLGRAQDMIVRNYFDHTILGCGQYVFSMIQAAGISYRSAGENIGWDAGVADPTASASYINGSLMNSPEHRANILNANYTHLGVGSWFSGATAWTGGGGSYQQAWMFAEEFAQLSAAPPPPTPVPHPPPPPVPHPPQPPTLPPRNSPAPPPPVVTPLTTAAPVTAAPTPVPAPVPTLLATPPATLPTELPQPSGAIAPAGTEGGLPAPLLAQGQGVLPDTVDAVLEAILVD